MSQKVFSESGKEDMFYKLKKKKKEEEHTHNIGMLYVEEALKYLLENDDT